MTEKVKHELNLVLKRNGCFNASRFAKDNNMAYVKVNDVFNDIVQPNAVYVITKSIDLLGKELILPDNCILFLKNGSIKNGVLRGNNTTVVAKNRPLFDPGNPKYCGYKLESGEFAYSMNSNGAVQLVGTWSNKQCGDKWTGLMSSNLNCASLAINNYIALFSEGALVAVPNGAYQIYQTINTNYHSVDFSGSFLMLSDFDSIKDDHVQILDSFPIVPLQHPGDMMRVTGDSVTIKNFIIDGGSLRDGNVASDAGVEHSIRIYSSKGSVLENITIQNAIGCGVAMNNTTSDITYKNVRWDNIGEHGVYTHTLHGFVRFVNCTFKNCGQSEYIHKLRNGYNACVRPSLATETNLINHSVHFEYEGCSFLNEGDIPVLTSYGGGASFKYIDCSWKGRVLGYSETSTLPEELGSCIEHIFINCDNPVSRYSGYNTLRRLYNCKNVRNLFEDLAEAHNCDCIWSYSDVYNEYRNGLTPGQQVLIDSCRFRALNDEYPRVVIHHPRSMLFMNCSFDFDAQDLGSHYNGYFILFKEREQTVPVIFSKCQFKRSLAKLIDSSNLELKVIDCNKGDFNISIPNKEKMKTASSSWRELF